MMSLNYTVLITALALGICYRALRVLYALAFSARTVVATTVVTARALAGFDRD